jgi:N-acetylglucosaminyldiphosphoundecaprenol N-acetyl-beta-D-mannosaminyltransferase
MNIHETMSDPREAHSIQEMDARITQDWRSNPDSADEHKDTSEVSFFGLRLNPKSMPELNALVERGVSERKKWIISNHNLHSVYLLHRRRKVREFYAAAHWTFIDGMPLVALGRLYGHPLEREQRVTMADWLPQLMELAADRGWRVFHLGSKDSVAEKCVAELRRRLPALQIESANGFFDARKNSTENEALLKRINAYRPDLLMVGMGMPRQEFWTQDNFDRLNAHVIMSSNGAAMEYIAGAVPTPPRWMGRVGLEWAFRLMVEPRRLFGRYLVEPWYLLSLLVLEYVRTGGRLKNSVQSEG